MKFILSLAVLAALAMLEPSMTFARAAEEDGVALGIVYDTSGSMKEPVRDRAGKPTPKYVIANRALIAVAQHIESFTTNRAGGAPRKLEAALFIFDGAGAKEAIPFGSFDAAVFEDWARHFASPGGNTPLGNALSAASRRVLNSPLPRKHVLIITDGMNTVGPQPAAVLPGIQRQAKEKQTNLSVHFVAFDVNAAVFAPVKKLGATVVSAADEAQLDTQLQFILQRKILLEDEEPAKKP